MKATQDLPHLQKKMALIDEDRLGKLRTARENKDIRHIAEAWAEEKLHSKIINADQRLAIHLMTDFVHNFPYTYIARRIGIELSELYAWRNDPFFLRELDKEINRRKSFIRIHAFRNVHRAIMRGDMKSTWMYLKMSGDLRENVDITIDRTGEQELSEQELNAEIQRLTAQLANGPVPSLS